MIPKVIHYCWFGRGKMPELAVKCIESWKKNCPDYEIKEWNEDNYDLDMFPYTREAYDNRKFAFVTDVVRLYVLYNEGGIYMDTDVEVLKPLDKFLVHHAFSGFESEVDVPTGIMASEKKGLWVKENLDYYNGRHFITPNGSFDLRSNVVTITQLLLPHGLKRDNSYQDIDKMITIYPKDYFCPKDYNSKEIMLTENTHCIHHFNGSWWTTDQKIRAWLVGKGMKRRTANIVSYYTYFPVNCVKSIFNGTIIDKIRRKYNSFNR